MRLIFNVIDNLWLRRRHIFATRRLRQKERRREQSWSSRTDRPGARRLPERGGRRSGAACAAKVRRETLEVDATRRVEYRRGACRGQSRLNCLPRSMLLKPVREADHAMLGKSRRSRPQHMPYRRRPGPGRSPVRSGFGRRRTRSDWRAPPIAPTHRTRRPASLSSPRDGSCSGP